MAKIHSCTYCGGNVCDSQWHPSCRIAHLEDILYQLRKLGESEILTQFAPQNPVSAQQHQVVFLGMRGILNQENWHSKEEFEAERTTETTRQLEDALEAGAKANWLVEQAKQWDLLHPKAKQPISVLGIGKDGSSLTFHG